MSEVHIRTMWYQDSPYQITYTVRTVREDQAEFTAEDIIITMIADADTMQVLDEDGLYQNIARLAREVIALGETEQHQEEQDWLQTLANP